MIFGALGLVILSVVAYVLFIQGRPIQGGPVKEPPATSKSNDPYGPFPPSVTPTPTVSMPTPNPQTYIVQSGDTLQSVAERFDITMNDLVSKNQILDPNKIRVGQKLELPQPGERIQPPTPSASKSADTIYIVLVGDTLFGVSQKLDVSVKDLSELNDIKDPTQLFVGTRLQVPERLFTPITPRALP